MKKKAHVVIEYTIKGKSSKIDVNTQLKKIKGLLKPRQNNWFGVATLNGREYNHPESEYYLNAQFLAEDIADIELNRLRQKHGRSLKVKRK